MVENLNDFNPIEHFKEYPVFEEYDPNKTYDDTFKKDFGKYGRKEYRNLLLLVMTREEGSKVKQYVAPEEIISKDDIELLKDYCQCDQCKTSWYNPLKYFMCPCCVGCFQTGNPHQYIIDSTREYYLANINIKSL